MQAVVATRSAWVSGNDKILVVGYNAWDVTVPLARIPAPDTKMEVAPPIQGGGGPAATAAVALARWGCRVTLVTPLADDPAGRWHTAALADEGVDVSRSPQRTGKKSPQAVILVDGSDGSRRILWSRGDIPRLSPDEVPVSLLDGVGLLYCDGHENPACALLAAEARRRGLPVVLDAGSVREGLSDLLPFCTDVIGALGFPAALTGLADPGEALVALAAMGPGRVAMTGGDSGVLALAEGGPRYLPAFAVPVIDTTGAGDVFHAGYAYALRQGRDFAGCLDFGQAAAALKCRAWGGRAGIPSLQEIAALLRSGRRRPSGLFAPRYRSLIPG